MPSASKTAAILKVAVFPAKTAANPRVAVFMPGAGLIGIGPASRGFNAPG
jgi:hypothetical protein